MLDASEECGCGSLIRLGVLTNIQHLTSVPVDPPFRFFRLDALSLFLGKRIF